MNSSHDMLAQVAMTIRVKAPQVLGKDAKRRGLPFEQYMDALPDEKKKALRLLTLLHYRYVAGDYQHSDRELGVLERIGNWLIEIHQTAGGHPVRPVTISPNAMMARKPLDDGRTPLGKRRPKGSTYREVLQQLQEKIGA